MSDDCEGVLRLFVQKVEYLESLSFVNALKDSGPPLRMKFNGSQLTSMKFGGPNREQIDAFVLTMRLFMQNKDPISIANVAKAVEAHSAPDELKRPFFEIRAILNDHLDSPCSPADDPSGPSRREVLDTVMYGELCHLSPNARLRYQSWTGTPLEARFVQMKFVGVAEDMLKVLSAMAERCRRILDWATEAG